MCNHALPAGGFPSDRGSRASCPKKDGSRPILPAPKFTEIGLVNIEHNRTYDHIVITLNQEGKELLECRLRRILPQYEHEFDCPDETSRQHLSGTDYTPCVFYNITHAPADTVHGDIAIGPYPETLILHANHDGISRLQKAVAALSEQQPETSCNANTVPDTNTSDAHDIPKPYASVITFRFIKDVSAFGIITPAET